MEKNRTPFFTVFTPVYNHKNEIHRVWESLQNQTFRDFEWIVVDDGSTDGVWPLLEKYKMEAFFSVILIRQENMGKHFAWNHALDIAKGVLFVPADSDDRFLENTLEFFHEKWNSISHENQPFYSGINVLCKDSVTGEIIGNKFPKDGLISNNLELEFKYKVVGEKWGCMRIDLLCAYKFPEIKGQGYYAENYIWFSIAKKYNVLCFNKILRIYYTNGNSITNSSKIKSFEKFKTEAPVKFDFHIWHLNENKAWMLRYDIKEYIISIINLCRYGLAMNKNIYEVSKLMQGLLNKIALVTLFIPSWLYYKFIDSKNIKSDRSYNQF